MRALGVPLIVVAAALALVLAPPLALFLYFLIAVRPLLERDAPANTASRPYSGGSVSFTPPKVVAGGEPVPVTISYRVGPDGIAPGGGLRLCRGKILRFSPDRWRLSLQWASGWGELQRRRSGRPNFVRVSTSPEGARLRVSMMEHFSSRTQLSWLKRKFLQRMRFPLDPMDPRDAFIHREKMTVMVEGPGLDEGDVVTFELGHGAGLEVPYNAMETDYAIEVDLVGSGSFHLDEAVPTLVATGGSPARLEVVAPSRAAPGEKIEVLVRCVDARAVLTSEFAGPLIITTSPEIDAPRSVLVPEGGDGTAWFIAVVTGRGVASLRVASGGGGIEGVSNPVVCAEGPYRLFWGDIHTHSLVSDGTREPSYFFHRARHLLGWDFTAVTDHDIWSLAEEHPRTPEEFALVMRECEAACVPGEFVTLPAFEWTDHYLGHRNVVFGPGETPEFLPHTDARYSTPGKLARALEGRNAMLVPHHPAWKTHRGEMRFDYGEPGNPLQRLVEVYSQHGNSEFYGCPRPMTHAALIEGVRGKLIRALMHNEPAGPRSGSYVRDALAAGHRLGLIAGSDEHLVGVDPRKGIGITYEGGITGIYATERTRESVWDALQARRVSATTGARIVMELNVNGSPQGSEIEESGSPRITGHVVGTAGIERAELVKFDGEGYSTPWSAEGPGPQLVLDFTDRAFKRDSFYYLRVVQADGHLGWAGPVWVDLR